MIELISIHIPKTGGISFRTTLKNVYGKNAVLNINHIPRFKNTENYFNALPEDITPEIKVIHGHFKYIELVERFGIDKNIPVITWMRDPTERVISNYFYLQRKLFDNLEKLGADEKTFQFARNLSKSVLQYALQPRKRNVMSDMLKGLDIKSLYFIGLVEHYSEDLTILSNLLGWNEYQEFQRNTTSSIKKEVSKKKKMMIRCLNLADLKLYRQATYLRKKRNRSIIKGA